MFSPTTSDHDQTSVGKATQTGATSCKAHVLYNCNHCERTSVAVAVIGGYWTEEFSEPEAQSTKVGDCGTMAEQVTPISVFGVRSLRVSRMLSTVNAVYFFAHLSTSLWLHWVSFSFAKAAFALRFLARRRVRDRLFWYLNRHTQNFYQQSVMSLQRSASVTFQKLGRLIKNSENSSRITRIFSSINEWKFSNSRFIINQS